MSLGFTLAMPVGTTWNVYSHKAEASLGEVHVLAHRRIGIELHWASINKTMTLAYPLDTHWKLDQDHIRVAGLKDGKLQLTFAPA